MPGISKAAKPNLAQTLEVLRSIVGDAGVRRGAPADAVCGVVPELCVEPADEAELSRVLQYANEAELMVSPRGGGTKLDWGTQPQGVDLAISTARFNRDRKSTRLNSSHVEISYAGFCLKKKRASGPD